MSEGTRVPEAGVDRYGDGDGTDIDSESSNGLSDPAQPGIEAQPEAAAEPGIKAEPAPENASALDDGPIAAPRRPLQGALSALRTAATAFRRRYHPVTLALIGATVLGYAVLAFQRRWLADDGMIAVRTARQILAGNGPTYSPYERTETDTSTLWTYLLALGGGITRVDIARVAVYGGLLCAVCAVAAALFASARLHARISGEPRQFLLPAGALILFGVAPYWDYATSGLETGLELLWLALCWLVLVVWCAGSPGTRRQYAVALLIGLAPLVRPEFALLEPVFGVAAWLLIRPGRRRMILLFVTGQALPVLYEVFRAGYYGELVPLPAVAKSASSSRWHHGWLYVLETMKGYFLWVPLLILLLATFMHLANKTKGNRVLLATPVVAGLLLGLYVVKVGGDFMHARMVLPALFLLLMPVLLLPATRLVVFALVETAVWAALVVHNYSVHWYDEVNWVSENEHFGYQQVLHNRNPDDSVAFTSQEQALINKSRAWHGAGDRVLSDESLDHFGLKPGLPFDLAVVAGRLGMVGAAVPLDDQVVDTLGLANPIGAHLTVNGPDVGGRGLFPGHEKTLNWAWILADYGDPAVVDNQWVAAGVPPAEVRAARHAMSCGALKELLDSTRQPMTFGRFWDNLTGSVDRTTLVVPDDPYKAEKKFCG